MKKIILIILLFASYSFAQAQDMKGMDMHQKDIVKKQQITSYYTCVMHPEIHADKPGNCPKCGMVLYKKTVNTAAQKTQLPKKQTMPMSLKGTLNKMDNMEQMQGSTQKQDLNNMAMPMLKIAPAKTLQKSEPPKTVRYDLYVRDTIVNFTGKVKHAIAVNGQIPMPTLTFTEGDTAEIYVHNELNEPTGLHWHGLYVPNKEDGVPYLTQMPIQPHTTYLYKFPIIQNGTHWYHSHFGLQEQIGMYGSLILKKRNDDTSFRRSIDDLPAIPIVLSDWADMNPSEIDRSLHAATDWFAIKKGTTQSYIEAIKSGNFKTKLTNEWKRMNAMDVSDVAYNKFFINGKSESEMPQFKAGDKVRLRISNGSASTYFWLTYSGGKITVVANDGNDVEPVEVDRLIIGVSETYDVVVTIPDNMQYEFLATPEDRTKSASLWLGRGMKMPAKKLPKLKYFAGMKMMNDMMDMKGNMVQMEGMNMQNQEMDMNTVMYPEITGYDNIKKNKSNDSMQMRKGKQMQMNHGNQSMAGMDMNDDNPDIQTLNYGMLRATHHTDLPPGPLKELNFELTGNMNRYMWSINNKVLSEADKILIKKGENVRIILYNNTMMRHPMHLHGHDFRVLNGQGDYAPLKNVLDIMPMERDTIEFAANMSGDWFFHCHILYHMMSGMGRVFSYENSPPNPEIPNPKLARRKLFAEGRMFHTMARIGLESNGSDGNVMLANTRWKATTLWNLGLNDKLGYESETMFGRYLGRMQWWFPYIGFDYHYKVEGGPKNIFGSEKKNWFGQTSDKLDRHTIVAGIAYTLPLLFVADARIDGNGKFRFQLSREDVPISKRLRFNMMINTDKEYMAGFRYIATKYISLSTHYDSDMGLGAGLTITY
ncbi:multicopper oxidase domain-containing protein [Hydrotalea sp.]|uniref:multicopper oxidase domain-containing protein n=1 Tax=Hydrotalea sp. TaxID=2881279 RepID=UPI00258378D1|nr:multicopper oxidase domain-containing protein [Hydrotalea sp.]